jgi:transcription factor AP-4
MLPKHDGEKLSKAAILQHTSEYIDTLEQEKTRLLSQHCQLKRVIGQFLNGQQDVEGLLDNHIVKRIKSEHNLECSNSDSSDEGIQCHPSPGIQIDSEPNIDELRTELVEVRKALDRERKLRMQLEEQVKMLESQLYPDKVREIAQQVQLKFCEGSSQGNSESEEAAAVASLEDDEVIGETIEIETHSCPESPSGHHQPTTIVISTPTNNIIRAEPIQIQSSQSSRIINVTEAKKLPRARNSSKAQQPAAIALPIDVPFISAGGAPGGTVTLKIIGPNSNDNQTVNMSNTSRHNNLETIVEAIRHLEGDHMFEDEDATVTVVKQEYDGEEIITSVMDGEEIELTTSESGLAAMTKAVKHVLTVSPEQLGAIRQQVIQCSQSRPGVIVAKNP